MKLSAPTVIVFLISLVVAVLGLLSYYAGMTLPLSSYHLMLVAWVVLTVGVVMKGL